MGKGEIMYYISKQLEISAAHKLALDYDSKCQNLHGHNWHIRIFCRSENLNANGMVYDFTHLKAKIHDVLDHECLNDILPCNPTAENIAKWIADTVGPTCYRVDVQESDGNVAAYKVE